MFALRWRANRVHIPHPKFDKLACQAQGVGIFTFGEILVTIALHPRGACFILVETTRIELVSKNLLI